jgi:hypothetical protein
MPQFQVVTCAGNPESEMSAWLRPIAKNKTDYKAKESEVKSETDKKPTSDGRRGTSRFDWELSGGFRISTYHKSAPGNLDR